MRKVIDAAAGYLRQTDIFLLILCIVSAFYGLTLISSATRSITGGSHVFVQSVAIVLGIIAFVIMSLLDLEILADRYKLLFVAGLAFIATLFIWGVEGGGNRAWLRFGGVFGIQPAELMKIPFIIVIASMITKQRDRRALNSVLSIAQILGVIGAYFLLIMVSSADLGTSLVYVFIVLIMLYMGGVYLRWFVLAAAVGAAAAPLIWTRFLSDLQRRRILVLFDPEIDPARLDEMWQVNLSLRAFSGGRFFGQGLYSGRLTQTDIIPVQHSDFILSAAGEELGFAGVIAVFALLLAIIVRCLYVGIKSNDRLGMLVCAGIAAMLIFQSLSNIGMCLGITPVIGLTLPFFSYGGSSIITVFAAAGIVSGVKTRSKPVRFRRDY